MVEGVEGSVGSNRELEAVSAAVVLDGDRERVVSRMPEQQDVDAVALACSELAGIAELRGSWVLLSWDVDLTHARGGRTLSDVAGQQPERVLCGRALDRPPDRVTAGAARGECRQVTKWAFVPLERGENGAALMGLVVVVEQVLGHATRLTPRGRSDIGGTP